MNTPRFAVLIKCANNGRSFVRAAALLLAVAVAYPARAEVVLLNESCRVTVDAATLTVNMKDSGNPEVVLSSAQEGLGPVAGLATSATNAAWTYPDKNISIALTLDGHRFSARVSAVQAGEFVFPVLPESANTAGWILPIFEGAYAPRGDARWAAFLTGRGPMDTTAEFTMPFIGLDYGNFTLTCLFSNAFNNAITFEAAADHGWRARCSHSFTRLRPGTDYTVVFEPGSNSPVAPALYYRNWLRSRGEFVSLQEKIKRTPDAAKLLGAAHIYLWGGGLIDRSDVRNWMEFCRQLPKQEHIWSLLKPPAQDAVHEIAKAQWPDKYNEGLIIDDLNRLLLLPQLSESNPAVEVSSRICENNCRQLAASFPGLMPQSGTWGNGVSPKMVKQLSAAGFDRLWLGADGWDAFVNRPATVAAAEKAGFLIGPYDSFNSIHRPGEADTWETAQFDSESLYENGAIVNADGKKRHGFKHKGYVLSPIAARPFVEERVSKLMNKFHANSWFVDCDGFGEYFDDYSPQHPAAQQDDMQARISRMAWIRDTYGAVIGTEGCSAGVASTVHFAHGVMTPVIGWGDPDLTNRTSKYYTGSYYPPDGPRTFIMPVPIKEEYRYIYFEPRFRLPLFQTVFHDSVVATHHWSYGSFKTRDLAKTVELMELLYNIPPLYHLNLEEFQKRREQMQRHYAFFSPLHRALAEWPMTDFRWLTPSRDVQQTTFGGQVDLVANFGTSPFKFNDTTIPPQTILAAWRNGEKKNLIYTP
jgi:hypothetical protein